MRARGDAFIDESGQRSRTAKSSDHFILSAVIVRPRALPRASVLLSDMRRELGRRPTDVLAWKNLKTHDQLVRAAQMLRGARFLRISTVIVCKRDFDRGRGKMPDDDFAYMYTFRLLLERMSWAAKSLGVVLNYTLAQIGRFTLGQLRGYEAKLKTVPDCTVVWAALSPKGGGIDQPSRVEYLQLADIAASATAQAFEPNRYGNIETRYLEELRPSIHCPEGKPITSYGLKMHPWNDRSKAAHPWLKGW
jgi:hypothetical protein